VATEMAEDVEDPLKALCEVYEPDSRQAHFFGNLADNHSVLSRMALHVQVPKKICGNCSKPRKMCRYIHGLRTGFIK